MAQRTPQRAGPAEAAILAARQGLEAAAAQQKQRQQQQLSALDDSHFRVLFAAAILLPTRVSMHVNILGIHS